MPSIVWSLASCWYSGAPGSAQTSATMSNRPETSARNRMFGRVASSLTTRWAAPGRQPIRNRYIVGTPGHRLVVRAVTCTTRPASSRWPRRAAVATEVSHRRAIAVQLARPSACKQAMILQSRSSSDAGVAACAPSTTPPGIIAVTVAAGASAPAAGARARLDLGQELAHRRQPCLALLDLRRVAGLLEDHQLPVGQPGDELLAGLDRRDPVGPAHGDEDWSGDLAETRGDVVRRQIGGERMVVRRVVVDRGVRPRLDRRRVVLVVVQRQDRLPAVLEIRVVAHLAGEAAVEQLHVDRGPLGVQRTLAGGGPEGVGGRGVAEYQGAHPVRIGERVLERDEPAVRAAGHDDLLDAGPLAQRVDVGRPLSVRVGRGVRALAAAARVEHDPPVGVGQRTEAGLGLATRADTGGAVVGDEHGGAGVAEDLDLELCTVEGDEHGKPPGLWERTKRTKKRRVDGVRRR